MAKESKRKQPKEETKKQAALSYRDQQARRRVIIGLIIGAVVVAGIILAGVLNELVFKPSSPVAVVNGERITTAQYQKMVRYQREALTQYILNLETEKARLDPADENVQSIIQFYDQLLSQAQSQLDNLGALVLDQMIEDLLIRQGAQKEGIVVTEEQIEQRIEAIFGYNPDPPTPTPAPEGAEAGEATPAPTPTVMTRETFEQQYAAYLENLKRTTGMTEADYRDLVRGLLYREALQELIGSRVPTAGEQVHARHILVADEATAQEVLEKLRAGGDFAELAKEYSTDTGTKENGGDLGWFGRGQMVKEFEDAAFSLPVGEYSEPVKSQFGYHIILVEEHDMNHPFDEATLRQLKTQAFDDWLEQARQQAEIQNLWTPDKMPPTPTPAFLPIAQ